MSRDTTVIPFRQPEAIDDPLTEVAREGARRMLAQVLIAEADAFVALWKDLKLPDGRDRVVRHGHGPQRAIQTGVGPVEVRRAKVRDRGEVGAEEKIRFTSAILPKWARRTKSLDALLPLLYLRGISTGDFQEALAALLGKDAPNLSPAVVTRLTAEWQAEYDAWQWTSKPPGMGRPIIARGGWEAGQEKVSLGVFGEAAKPEFRKCSD
jgi:putative transposase